MLLPLLRHMVPLTSSSREAVVATRSSSYTSIVGMFESGKNNCTNFIKHTQNESASLISSCNAAFVNND